MSTPDHTAEPTPSLTRVEHHELDLVARLVATLCPDDGGPTPGAQLCEVSTTDGPRRAWTIVGDELVATVQGGGAVPEGFDRPVWLAARTVWFAAEASEHEGRCGMAIDDQRPRGGDASLLIASADSQAHFVLHDRPARPHPRPPDGGSASSPGALVASAVLPVESFIRALRSLARTPMGQLLDDERVGSITFGRHQLVLASVPAPGESERETATDAPDGGDVDGGDADVLPPARFRLRARTATGHRRRRVQVRLRTLWLACEQLPAGDLRVRLDHDGRLWLCAGPCRLIVPTGAERTTLPSELADDAVDPDRVSVIYVAGEVEPSGRRLFSLDGDCPDDGTIVWLEHDDRPPAPMETFEDDYDIVWHAEPEPYGVIVHER